VGTGGRQVPGRHQGDGPGGLDHRVRRLRGAGEGCGGLIHISEMSWTKHIRHPNKILTENQEVECMVLKVDKANEKISLGLKQVSRIPG